MCNTNNENFLWIANSSPDVQYRTLNMRSLDVTIWSCSVHDVSPAVWERLHGGKSCYGLRLRDSVSVSMGMRDCKIKSSSFRWTLCLFGVDLPALNITFKFAGSRFPRWVTTMGQKKRWPLSTRRRTFVISVGNSWLNNSCR